MINVSHTHVSNWTTVFGYHTPNCININCPHCSKLVGFKTELHHYDTHRETMACTATCPSCNDRIHFWIVSVKVNQLPDKILVFPESKESRLPIPGYELMPERLRKAYTDTLGVYNSGIWSATATCCRRTLEGIIRELLPEDQRTGNLANQIRQLATHVNLAQPLITLSNSVREGGNLGAHFDLDREPDVHMSQAMVDLLEYLIEYVFILPKSIDNLNARM